MFTIAISHLIQEAIEHQYQVKIGYYDWLRKIIQCHCKSVFREHQIQRNRSVQQIIILINVYLFQPYFLHSEFSLPHVLMSQYSNGMMYHVLSCTIFYMDSHISYTHTSYIIIYSEMQSM